VLANRIVDAVEDRLRQQHLGSPTLYRRELGICVGAGRIDLAAVNGAITGCEVKSSRDGLARLPLQVKLYSRVVDRAVLAVERTRPGVVADLVPGWWGVWHVIEVSDEEVALEVLREPAPNPCIDAAAVAQLLWRDEAFDLLKQLDLHRGLASATRWRLWDALTEHLSLEELQAEVRQRLRARQDW
jgi:hypothetical protein